MQKNRLNIASGNGMDEDNIGGNHGTILLHGAFFNVLGWLWPILLYLFVTPFLVRKLGVDGYGVYSLLLLLAGYTGCISAPISQANTKYTSQFYARKDWNLIGQAISISLILQAIIGIVIGSILFVASDWIATDLFNVPPELFEEAKLVFRIGGVIVALTTMLGVFSGIIQGLQRFDIYNIVNMIAVTFNTLLIMGFLIAAFGLREVILVQPLYILASILIFIFICIRLLPGVRWFNHFSRPLFVSMSIFAVWLFINQLVSLLTFQAGKTMVGIFLSTSQLTYFTIASSLAGLLQSFGASLATGFFPLSAQLMERDSLAHLTQLYKKATRWFVFIVGGIGVAYISAGAIILRYWIGADFEINAYPVLLWLTGWGLWHAFGAIPYSVANGTGHPRVNTFFAVIFGVTNLFAVLLVAKLGSVAIAIGSFVSVSVVAPIYIGYVHRYILRLSNLEVIREIGLPFVLTGALAAIGGRLIIGYARNWIFAVLIMLIIGAMYFVLALIFRLVNILELQDVLGRLCRILYLNQVFRGQSNDKVDL